jgi:hypothetical protein
MNELTKQNSTSFSSLASLSNGLRREKTRRSIVLSKYRMTLIWITTLNS